MSTTRYDCNCDLVIDMENMAIGIEEILQYARAVLAKDDVRALVRGLEEVLGGPEGEGAVR
jgi:hypothetical protein